MADQLDSFVSERSEAHPMIYAYSDSNPMYQGLLKVGFTAHGVEKRVAQQYPTKCPDGKVPYKIVFCRVCHVCRWRFVYRPRNSPNAP